MAVDAVDCPRSEVHVMTDRTPLPKRTGEMQEAWLEFVDSTESLRRDLHRYCRRMTRTVWDAEDLVQETMLRCFGSMRAHDAGISNPRAFMYRTATNLWIDSLRRRETESTHADQVTERARPAERPAGAARDAGVALFGGLPPKERAALVLKDVLEFSLAEIAEILETTTGAVKSALHRARNNLQEVGSDTGIKREPPSAELVDRFVTAFNALDIPALTSLLLQNVTVEVVGIASMCGRVAATSREGWVQKSLFGHEPWALEAQQPARQQRAERFIYQGEPIVVVWMARDEGESVEWLCRIEEDEGRVAGIRDYCLSPETQTEVAESLGLPIRPWGYRLSDDVLAWERDEDGSS